MANHLKVRLSILSIFILVIAFVLIPKQNNKSQFAYVPGYSIRRIPPPTNKPEVLINSLKAHTQPPGHTVSISEINIAEPVFIKVFQNNELVGNSDLITESTANYQINLAKETRDGDVLEVVLFNEQDKLLYTSEVHITTTALIPGSILPKDLNN